MEKGFEGKKIHIIGIEGAGTSALARILKASGAVVSGSDEGDHFFHGLLASSGIEVAHRFDAANVPADADLIVYGSSFRPETNPELKAAFDSGKEVAVYAEALAELFNGHYGIAVCGTHGKTTTSAMLASAMEAAGADPSAIIGGKVIDWDGNSLVGQREFFVAETDEYQNKLRFYAPKAAVLTSCDYDHPDFFPTFAEYKQAFADFAARIPRGGFLVVWGDSIDTLEVARSARCETLSYGFSEDCAYRVSDPSSLDGVQAFGVMKEEKDLGTFEIALVGRHNVLNAAAAIAVCHKLGLDLGKVREALRSFKGTARRFQRIGERKGAILIDDYAHHPEELKATLKAARERYPDRNIWAVFHPHTFTRTKALLQDFAQSFDNADRVIVLDIYGSAREKQGGVDSKELVNLINKYSRGKAEHVPTIPEAIEFLGDRIGPEDLVISIGAGDVWRVTDELKN